MRGQYQKSYFNVAEYEAKKANFLRNIEYIAELNADPND